MDERIAHLAARAADQHNVLTTADFDALGVSQKVRANWLRVGLLERVGTHTFAFSGAPRTWEQSLMSALLDVGRGAVAGRSGAALLGLDGFRREDVGLLVPRHLRNRRTNGRVVATTRPVPASDLCVVDGIRCLRAERLILEAPLFDFTREELENAIDSAIRLRLTSDRRLRVRVAEQRSLGVNGSRSLVDALVDAGGESKLERAFLSVLRRAGLPRPSLQVSHRDGSRLVARVDTEFDDELVIEVEGHATHSSRRQRQRDEQRRTELVLLGKRVIAFTYDDVMRRPEWTAATVRGALSREHARSGSQT